MINLKELMEEGAFSPLSPTEQVKILFESPVKIKSWVDDNLHSIGKNLAFTKIVKQKCKIVGKFDNYEIYKNTLGMVNYDYFTEGEYIKAMFIYIERTHGKFMVGEKVWQDGLRLGLCREIMFDYYLQKYDAVISDQNHSDLGENYWKQLVKDAKAKGFKTFVLNTETNEKTEIDVKDMDQYWSENETYFIYRFMIGK